MSFTIYFKQPIKFADITKDTEIGILNKGDDYWLSYNNNTIFIEKDVIDGEKYMDGLTSNGDNTMMEILDIIILTYNVQILDEDTAFFPDESLDIDHWHHFTENMGYKIHADGKIVRSE
jgi:hypothetical protein